MLSAFFPLSWAPLNKIFAGRISLWENIVELWGTMVIKSRIPMDLYFFVCFIWYLNKDTVTFKKMESLWQDMVSFLLCSWLIELFSFFPLLYPPFRKPNFCPKLWHKTLTGFLLSKCYTAFQKISLCSTPRRGFSPWSLFWHNFLDLIG